MFTQKKPIDMARAASYLIKNRIFSELVWVFPPSPDFSMILSIFVPCIPYIPL